MSSGTALEAYCTCRQFVMNVLVQQAGQPPKSLQFHPWQSTTPDENITDVDATAVISDGGVTDDADLALSAYRLFLQNSTDEGTLHMYFISIVFIQCALVHRMTFCNPTLQAARADVAATSRQPCHCITITGLPAKC